MTDLASAVHQFAVSQIRKAASVYVTDYVPYLQDYGSEFIDGTDATDLTLGSLSSATSGQGKRPRWGRRELST